MGATEVADRDTPAFANLLKQLDGIDAAITALDDCFGTAVIAIAEGLGRTPPGDSETIAIVAQLEVQLVEFRLKRAFVAAAVAEALALHVRPNESLLRN